MMVGDAMKAMTAVMVTGLTVLVAGCAPADRATADPEAQSLSPPVVIVEDEPEPDHPAVAEAEPDDNAPSVVSRDPNTEVITFTGADAPPGMADQVTAAPEREPLPSMMSDIGFKPK